MILLEGSRGAHDILTESNGRYTLRGQNVCLGGVGEVDTAIQVLVHFEV
jgi:hypothetical protein